MFGLIRRVALGLFRSFKRVVLRDPFLLQVKRWERDRGDATLRMDYPLSPESVVVDLGGYMGDFAQAMWSRFACKVLVYEPVPAFHAQCCRRFEGNPAIRVFMYGLGAQDGEFDISDAADASSFVRSSPAAAGVIKAHIRPVVEAWREAGVESVDLLKINIEGGEYDVLPAVLNSEFAARVKNIQVQFHDFVEGAHEKREAIRQLLTKTHEEQWCYEFVWESWTLKS